MQSTILSVFPGLPFKEPVLVFTILISIILLAPVLFKKLRVPGIIGLIVSGMIIGSHGLNLIESGESINLLSTAGLLYLMFLAGLELDSRDFMRNREKSLIFGALTFFIPLVFGLIVSHYLLSYNFLQSLLIASMFSTHTLIAYPIASRLGITRSEAVMITIGGTIITDTAVLVLLAFISAASLGTFTMMFWIRMILSISAFSWIILWGVPKASAWFFKNLEGESGSQYVFVLAMLFISALLARLAGVEPIIGAFLAGLALSRLIPHTSALMNRISFIGNNLFIPIFLISVGMMVDFTVFFRGFGAMLFAGTLVVVAVSSKFSAAWALQKIFGYSKNDRQVIFGLSVSHAAAIIAVAIVGYNLKLIGLEVVNGAIMIILVTCFIGSFVTERSGRKLAIDEAEKMPVRSSFPERILVPVSNPATIESLIDFAILIREQVSGEPVSMLTVIPDDAFAEEQILKNNKMFESAISHAAAADTPLTLVSRVDLNIANGISRAVKELMINKIVIGWNGKITTSNFFFGSIIDNLIDTTDQMVMVVKSSSPFYTNKRMVIAVPDHAQGEAGFVSWIKMLNIFAKRNSSKIVFAAPEKTLSAIRQVNETENHKRDSEYRTLVSSHPIADMATQVVENDLFIVIAARRRTLSYSHYLETVPRDLSRYFVKTNFIILYPEQRANQYQVLTSSLDGLQNSAIPDSVERYASLSRPKRSAPAKRHNTMTE